MDKRFWGFLVLVALLLGAIFFVSNTHKAAAPGSASKGTLTNHVEGSSPSGVKLVEYGDYQCPACGNYYQAVKDVATKYQDRVVFQFRNFPLYQIHPNAFAGARAAEAADLQGKFWQMHDKLYQENVIYYQAQAAGQTYHTWIDASDPTTEFNQYATDLGLDLAKFQQDYKSSAVNDRIQADLAEGNKLGVDSTPTFFLDGKKISNPDATVDAFSKVLDAELAKKGAASTPAPSPTPAPAPSGQ